MEWSARLTITSWAIGLFMAFTQVNHVGGAYGRPDNNFKTASSESAAILETQIELTISAKRLRGPRSIIHPYCITYTKPENSEKWTPYHETERLRSTTNALFSSKVRIPYVLMDAQEVKFEIYSKAGPTGPEEYNYPHLTPLYRGYAQSKLKDILEAGQVVLPIRDETEHGYNVGDIINLGHIVVQAEKLDSKSDKVILSLHDKDVTNKRWFSSPKHFFEIFKIFEKPKEGKEGSAGDEDDYALVYRTKVNESYDHDWKVVLPFNTFCSLNRNLKLKFVCWDDERYVGEFFTTADEIENHKTEFTLKNQKDSPVGGVRISGFILHPVPSFSEFMAAGLELDITIAIDYTRSNGLPENPEGFHYQKSRKTRYEKALSLVVTAFTNFNWDNKYSVRLLGALKEGRAEPLDDHWMSPSLGAQGLPEVLESYRNVLRDTSIKQGEKVNLIPLISRIARNAKHADRPSKEYYVLVILMVGDIQYRDWELEQALESAFDAPLSIIFVGIDDTGFERIKRSYKTIFKTGKSRDFLYFVPFYESDARTIDARRFSYRQAELLAKLPEQVVAYMHSKEIRP